LAVVHRELKRKHVTLSILWDEYIERNPEGYRYSRFCELYRSWEGKLSVTMRQSHVGGDKLFVDYAGDTVPVIRPADRRDASSANLCRRPRRLKLHLRGGDLDAGAIRLDRPHTRAFAAINKLVPVSGFETVLSQMGRWRAEAFRSARRCFGDLTE
jgi:hypothetical protein